MPQGRYGLGLGVNAYVFVQFYHSGDAGVGADQ